MDDVTMRNDWGCRVNRRASVLPLPGLGIMAPSAAPALRPATPLRIVTATRSEPVTLPSKLSRLPSRVVFSRCKEDGRERRASAAAPNLVPIRLFPRKQS